MSGVFGNFYGSQASGAPLSITITPGGMYKFRVGGGTITSLTDTGAGTGGTGPYTYAWTYISGDSFTINSPSSAATTFTTIVPPGVYKSGTYRCTVTDSLSNTAYGDVLIEFEAL